MENNAMEVTNPLWAHEELQGSDFSMVRACGQCLWQEITKNRDALAAKEAENAELRAKVERLREALAEEREENLWNAYHTGHEKNGRWSHMFMSDGEWLARQCGLDPTLPDYDAAEIKAAIPKAARATLAETQPVERTDNG